MKTSFFYKIFLVVLLFIPFLSQSRSKVFFNNESGSRIRLTNFIHLKGDDNDVKAFEYLETDKTFIPFNAHEKKKIFEVSRWPGDSRQTYSFDIQIGIDIGGGTYGWINAFESVVFVHHLFGHSIIGYQGSENPEANFTPNTFEGDDSKWYTDKQDPRWHKKILGVDYELDYTVNTKGDDSPTFILRGAEIKVEEPSLVEIEEEIIKPTEVEVFEEKEPEVVEVSVQTDEEHEPVLGVEDHGMPKRKKRRKNPKILEEEVVAVEEGSEEVIGVAISSEGKETVVQSEPMMEDSEAVEAEIRIGPVERPMMGRDGRGIFTGVEPEAEEGTVVKEPVLSAKEGKKMFGG